MVMGFKLNLKLGPPFKSPFLTNSSPRPSSCSSRGKETSYESARLSLAFVISGQSENSHNDPLRAHKYSSALQTLENDYSDKEEAKMNIDKTAHSCIQMLDDNIQMTTVEDKSSFLTSLQASKASASPFGLLMENLDMLEATFSDSDVGRLERDILTQLERLGALNLFLTCLSRTLESSPFFDLSDIPTQIIKEPQMNGNADVHMGKVIVRSGKKEGRKSRRKRTSRRASGQALPPSISSQKDFHQADISSIKGRSNLKSRRATIARNEAEMSRGVKLVENLERIRMVLEEETGQTASSSNWAEAAGVDVKVLHQQLHFGWYCRDELLRSARSLVLYLARNYRGLGVAHEDLIQAGNLGVLQGAVRFDHTKGYKFSTYVQYWIRKSMSALVAQHSRGIRIPFTLSKAINQIQKARKTLNSRHGRYPDDDEIARLTGLSLAKITSASKCLRVVGSIDQKMGHSISAKFLEFTPDASIKSPEETVLRQHMIKDIYDLVNNLDLRERQVLALRFGLGDHHRKSLEEIGRLFGVSKEWIRRMELRALSKLRHENSQKSLSHYLYL
ncbi:LOW QUALITY PROTEIN: RNA polymerase sigma factor sigC [Diospyros lotus]|uniref:LOW QUALITY PROTEIN: RNA polymerase sigma factor sigC n=1 Tax=Diospyros lotus TaxID=55363 RepID=UPI00224DE601|nr:LOW QUALITY PROTEIN: RNA polymerase sigma factor sigC [Diospyros lotus]